MLAAKSHVVRWCVVLAAVCVLPLFAVARRQDSPSQQDSSVADAARRARERKQKAPKAGKVITDEDLPTKNASGPDTLNTGVQSTPGSESTNLGEAGKSDAAAQGAVDGQAAGKEAGKGQAEEDPEVARLKEQVAQEEKDLDLLKREFALDKEAYYSKADYASDTAGKDKLDSEQQQISDKQQDVQALKARLQELLSRKPKTAQAPAAGQNEKPANAPPQR